MAITIDSNPDNAYHFAYRPVVWTVSSNDATVVRCLADIYINGTYLATLEKSPDFGETDVFTFDVASVLQDNLKAYEPTFTDAQIKLYSDDNSGLNYTIRFFEVLDNGTTFTTTWAENGAGTGYTNSTTVYNPAAFAYNGTLRHNETQNLAGLFRYNGTYAGMSRLNKVTTTYAGASCNKARKLKRNDFAVLTGYYSANTLQGRLIEYDVNGSILATNVTSTNSSATSFLHQFGADSANFNASTRYILMRLETTSPIATTDYSHFEIVDCDNDYVSLYWQNDVGGIDYYLFRDGQVKTIGGETETYKQPLSASFNVYDFGQTVLNKNNETEISAMSEPLDRIEADALSNVFTHAVRAWIYDGTSFVPVVVQNGSIEALNTFDGEYRVNISLLHSNKHKAQRY